MARYKNAEIAASVSGAVSVDEYEFGKVLPEHIPAIAEIEKRSRRFPWSENLLRDCLRENYHFHALFRQRRIIAYGVISCILNEAHILNLCVSLTHRRQGLGRQMLDYLLDIARRQRAHAVFLEVRKSNHIAKRLYETNGFNQLGGRPAYYPADDGREDALFYKKHLD